MAAPDTAAAVEKLGRTGRDLVALLATARAERLRREPEGGGWSPAAVVSHLADAELVYSVRFRMTLTADRPYLPAFDEQAWVRRFAELEADPKETLVRWRLLREANVSLLESLDEDEWQLTGLHPDRGELSVAKLAEVLVAHDRDHLAQMRAGLADD